MNQRIKKSQERNNKNGATIQTGGAVTRHTPEEVNVRIPNKTTGDVSPEKSLGIAKASPNFKPIEAILPKDLEKEKKVIAEATKVVTPVKVIEPTKTEDVINE